MITCCTHFKNGMIWVLCSKTQSKTPGEATRQTSNTTLLMLQLEKHQKRKGSQAGSSNLTRAPHATCITLAFFCNQQCHVQGTSTRDTQHWQQLTNYGLPSAQPVLERRNVFATFVTVYQVSLINTAIQTDIPALNGTGMVVSPQILAGVLTSTQEWLSWQRSIYASLGWNKGNLTGTQNCIIKDERWQKVLEDTLQSVPSTQLHGVLTAARSIHWSQTNRTSQGSKINP